MPESITERDACYALDLVETICTQVGPGLPGSPQERERAAVLKNELESYLGADNVVAEEFTFAPRAFVSAYPISAFFLLVATLLNIFAGTFTGSYSWLIVLAAFAFSILAPLPFIFEFIYYREWYDPFFIKKHSVNVIGTLRKPGTENVKRLLILSGHHDSAPENTWLHFLGYGFFLLTAAWILAFIALPVMGLIQLAGVIAGNDGIVRFGTLGWILLAYPVLPAILFGLFFNRGWKDGGTVPGAADNLSACASVLAMCRFLVNNPANIPDDTEIRFVSFGAEEAGLRGSRHYVERHLAELKSLDARLLNLETIAHPEIAILTSEMNGLVKNRPEMVRDVVAAAERAGIPYKLAPATLGVGNDAGPFSQAGLKATTLLGFKMPQQMVAFYHQDRDRPEVLTVEPLFNVLKLALEWVGSGEGPSQTSLDANPLDGAVQGVI